VLVMGILVGIAALTQGNLGTAFRHREQMLWGLALCAAAGAEWLVVHASAARRVRGHATLAQAPADDRLAAPAGLSVGEDLGR
jgi:hypothetical protein